MLGESGQLTRRQIQIVNLALSGLTNRQIAESLGLRVQTVKNQLGAVYERLGFRPSGGHRAETRSRALQESLSSVTSGAH